MLTMLGSMGIGFAHKEGKDTENKHLYLLVLQWDLMRHTLDNVRESPTVLRPVVFSYGTESLMDHTIFMDVSPFSVSLFLNLHFCFQESPPM